MPRSRFRLKAISRFAVPDNLSFRTAARSLSLMPYCIGPLFYLFPSGDGLNCLAGLSTDSLPTCSSLCFPLTPQ